MLSLSAGPWRLLGEGLWSWWRDYVASNFLFLREGWSPSPLVAHLGGLAFEYRRRHYQLAHSRLVNRVGDSGIFVPRTMDIPGVMGHGGMVAGVFRRGVKIV